jgi:hypothetical protein
MKENSEIAVVCSFEKDMYEIEVKKKKKFNLTI